MKIVDQTDSIDEESTLGQAVQSYFLLKLMDQGQYLRNYWREHIEKVPEKSPLGGLEIAADLTAGTLI